MKGRKIELTDKEVAYLTKHFKHMKNAELAAKLNIGERSVVRLARKLGLTKTAQFMRKCQQEMTAAAHASHLRNGTYPPKGFIIPKSEDGRFKKGVTPEQRFGKRKGESHIWIATAHQAPCDTSAQEEGRVALLP